MTEPHVCRICGCDLVQAHAWEAIELSCWRVTLRCPNCWWMISAVLQDEALWSFRAALDAGMVALLTEYQRLSSENLAEDIERFVAALRGGHVLPEDF